MASAATPASEPVVVVSGLSKRFGVATAVDDVSFQAGRGEILGLLGPNGAGKTTTLQMLLGLTTPSAGHARILGLDLATERHAILQRVNFSSAYVNLPFNLSAYENLNVFARLYGVRRPAEKIRALLDLFEIADARNKITGSLSTGQQTRLNLCKAFLMEQPTGRGHVIAFAEDPNFRAYAEATELLFLNAVLLGPAY